jgi:hypothetical protein
VSRTVPSRRTPWWRSTPSFLAPRRSIARFAESEVEVVGAPAHQLRASVSNACCYNSSLAVVFTALRCTLFAYQVQPISSRSIAGTMSW